MAHGRNQIHLGSGGTCTLFSLLRADTHPRVNRDVPYPFEGSPSPSVRRVLLDRNPIMDWLSIILLESCQPKISRLIDCNRRQRQLHQCVPRDGFGQLKCCLARRNQRKPHALKSRDGHLCEYSEGAERRRCLLSGGCGKQCRARRSSGAQNSNAAASQGDDLDVYEGQRECRHCGYERTVIINHGCGLYLEPATNI